MISDSRVEGADPYGVSMNNPFYKIAKDLHALMNCDQTGGSNMKWLALSIRNLIRRPFFTGECDEALNLVDPGSLLGNGGGKRRK